MPRSEGTPHPGLLGPLWRLLAAGALGSVVAWGIVQGGPTPAAGADAPPFKVAPDFSTFDIHGNSRTLGSYLQAKPVLLEFMSPDCPHCLEMAMVLARAHETYRDRVQFLTVAFDKSVRRVQQFVQFEGHRWPYLMGSQQIIEAYRLEGVPTFYFLASDGRVVSVVVGSMPERALREHLEALLKAR